MDGHFSNHLLNRYILVILELYMYQNDICTKIIYVPCEFIYVPKLNVPFYLTVLLNYSAVNFLLYIELLQRHLVRWSSYDNSLQLQPFNVFI